MKSAQIDELLDAAKMTKTQLSIELGINRATIYHWREEWPLYAVVFLKERKKSLELQESLTKLREYIRTAKENGL